MHGCQVVPLFETLDDLSNAPEIMESLWSTPWYKGDTDGAQEVMLGNARASNVVKISVVHGF